MDESGRLMVPSASGGVLEVLTGGDPHGFGWLYHSGSPSAAARFSLIEESAREQGLRMVTYSRPGYGASTPRPDGEQSRMVDDVADVTAVLAAVGVDDFVTLGWSGGGPRALACAALLAPRCRAAATLAGVAPFDAAGLDWTAGMAPENHAEYAAAVAGPGPYADYLTTEALPSMRVTPDELAAALGGLLTPVDVAALTGDYASYLTECFHRAATQGVVGMRDDGLAATRAWGFALDAIEVPVAVWQGRQDAMVPYAHGEWLAAHVPTARPHLFDDEGHLSLVARLPEILADLRGLAGLGSVSA